MATIRDLALDWLLATVNASNPAGVPDVREGYLFSVPETQMPATGMYPVRDDALVIGAENLPSLTQHTMTVRFTVIGKGAAGVPPHRAIEPILAHIQGALSGKRSFGNAGPIQLTFEDETAWDYEQADHGYVKASIDVGVKYQHAVNNPSQWA